MRHRNSFVFSLCLAAQTVLFPAHVTLRQVPDPQKPSASRIDLPAFGLSMIPPKGLERTFTWSEDFVAGWIGSGPAGSANRSGIIVETEITKETDLNKVVARTAERFHCLVESKPAKLDGEPAAIIYSTEIKGGSHLLKALLSIRGGVVYKLGAFGSTMALLEEPFSSIREGWKWLPVSSPAPTVNRDLRAYTVRDLNLSLNIPETMRELRQETPGKTKLFIYDYRNHMLSFIIDISSMPKSPGISMDQLKRRFGAAVAKKMGLPTELTWIEELGEPTRFICRAFEPPAEHREGAYQGTARYGIVKLTDQSVALVSFTFSGKNADDRLAYDKLADSIMASVSILKSPN